MKAIAAILAAALLSGCVNLYPIPIKEPAVDQSGNPVAAQPSRVPVPAKDTQRAIDNLKIYGDLYASTSDELRTKGYWSNEATFAGGALGVVGGLTKSVETAIVGAVVAGGSSIVAERYNIAVQALNYEKAADAMYCMHTMLYEAPVDSVGFTFINARTDDVKKRLRKVQQTVELASPDLSKLQQALMQKGKTENLVQAAQDENQKNQMGLDAANKTVLALATAEPSEKNTSEEKTAAAASVKTWQQAVQASKAKVAAANAADLQAGLVKCVAEF